MARGGAGIGDRRRRAGRAGRPGRPPFLCEAFVRDFGSPLGALVLSERTERRVREQLRGGRFWYAIHPTRMRPAYARSTFIDQLVDWGWFGAADARPDWWPAGRL